MVFALFILGAIGGFILAALAGGLLLLPADRRRLEVLVAEMLAERRIDLQTRATLQAMREVARRDRS